MADNLKDIREVRLPKGTLKPADFGLDPQGVLTIKNKALAKAIHDKLATPQEPGQPGGEAAITVTVGVDF